MIQPEQVVEEGQSVMVFQGVDVDVGHGNQSGGDEVALVIEKVDGYGIQIPEDEKKGTELYQSPSPLHVKFLALDGEDENSHGHQKEKMAQLMDKNAFFGTVHLGGLGPVWHQENNSCQSQHCFH